MNNEFIEFKIAVAGLKTKFNWLKIQLASAIGQKSKDQIEIEMVEVRKKAYQISVPFLTALHLYSKNFEGIILCSNCNRIEDGFASRDEDKAIADMESFGSELVTRKGRCGEFLGCENYPICEFTAPFEENRRKPEKRRRGIGNDIDETHGDYGITAEPDPYMWGSD